MFVKGLIDANFKGSHFQAILDTLPQLSTYGHGKGLAMALGDLPLNMAEVGQVCDKLQGDVSKGFVDNFGIGAMRKIKDRDSRLHGKLTKGD